MAALTCSQFGDGCHRGLNQMPWVRKPNNCSCAVRLRPVKLRVALFYGFNLELRSDQLPFRTGSSSPFYVFSLVSRPVCRAIVGDTHSALGPCYLLYALYLVLSSVRDLLTSFHSPPSSTSVRKARSEILGIARPGHGSVASETNHSFSAECTQQ